MKEKTGSSKGKIFAIAMLAGVLVLFAAVSFWLTREKSAQTKREQIPDIVEFSSVPDGASIEATINMNGRTEAVSVDGTRLVLSPEQQKNFHLPYVLKATIKNADVTYYDFWWDVGRNGAEYYIGASGFDPDDRAILAIDNQPVQNILFDWSGRIEFAIILIVRENQKSCIYTERANNQKLGACHFTVGKPDA